MKKMKIILPIVLLVFGIPVVFVYLTISNSIDCSQLVIDTYEIHSGIDIPDVNFVNCYYDENSDTRISVYDLNTNMDLSKFEVANIVSGSASFEIIRDLVGISCSSQVPDEIPESIDCK